MHICVSDKIGASHLLPPLFLDFRTEIDSTLSDCDKKEKVAENTPGVSIRAKFTGGLPPPVPLPICFDFINEMKMILIIKKQIQQQQQQPLKVLNATKTIRFKLMSRTLEIAFPSF